MRKVALLFNCVVLLLLTSCTPRPDEGSGDPVPTRDSRQSEADREYYILPVDSVSIARTAAGATIRVTGPLGDGCQKFAYTDSTRNGNTLDLTFWASRPKAKDVACTMIMQYYNTEIVVRPGEYSDVAIHRQDKSVIRESLAFEPGH